MHLSFVTEFDDIFFLGSIESVKFALAFLAYLKAELFFLKKQRCLMVSSVHPFGISHIFACFDLLDTGMDVC